MPWGVAAGVAGSVLGSVASNALAPSTGSSSAGSAYVPYNQYGLDQSFNSNYTGYQNALNSYYGTMSSIAPTLLGQVLGNPYQSNYLGGLNTAQGAYYGLGANAGAAGAADYGLGQQLAGASANWGLNGNELQQLQQQSADTANSQSYLRGTQNSPYGAAVAANAVDNTNLNYAQTQAQTQAALAQAATGAYGAGTNQYGIGAQAYQTGAGLPYGGYNNISQQGSQALNSYYGALSPYLSGSNQLQGNALQYLGYGNTAQNTAANQALASSQNAQGLGSAYGNIGGQLGTALGGYFGSSSPSYGFSTGSSILGNPGSYDYFGSGAFSY